MVAAVMPSARGEPMQNWIVSSTSLGRASSNLLVILESTSLASPSESPSVIGTSWYTDVVQTSPVTYALQDVNSTLEWLLKALATSLSPMLWRMSKEQDKGAVPAPPADGQ